MSILCRNCGREYDVTLFSFGGKVRCECGREVRREEGHVAPAVAPTRDRRRRMREIALGADRIVAMILYSDLPRVDIEIEIARLRDRAEELFPGSGDTFRRIYEARFERIAEQWRD